MLHCNDCDYFKVESNFTESGPCKKYRCEFADFIFPVEDLYELTEYPCCRVNTETGAKTCA